MKRFQSQLPPPPPPPAPPSSSARSDLSQATTRSLDESIKPK